jgi:nitroreductase
MTQQASTLLQERYGNCAPSTPQAINATIEVMLNHRSVRHYLSTPVTDDQLHAIIAAAQSAASSSNLQAWSVVAVREQHIRDRLCKLALNNADYVRQAPLNLVWLADLNRLDRIARLEQIPSEGLDYFDTFLIGAIDATLAAQNAAIAAESMGLGTVYIGGLRNDPLGVAEVLGLPPKVLAVFGMCVGTPDPAVHTDIKPRLPQNVVLHHERYSTETQVVGVADYNATMAQFYAKQKMNVRGTWTRHSTRCISGANPLGERGELMDTLRKMGFALK